MQRLVDSLIDSSQAAFVPGRIIADNIILGHELVKEYSKKDISLRCMLKIDMQKAYNSVKWPFLEQVMIHLSFPEKLIKWILACAK